MFWHLQNKRGHLLCNAKSSVSSRQCYAGFHQTKASALGRKGRKPLYLEDDHDSEFRYKGKPIPALQSLDKAGKVIYIGTFSKAISPAIRTGYMVLPMALLPRFERLIDNYSCPVSRIEQAILTDFIKQGYFEKHLNRMRKYTKGNTTA